jgi:hypothetical protein
MVASKDWLPTNREQILEMAIDWQSVITSKICEWGIPPEVLRELGVLLAAAANALTVAKNETTRTPVTTAQCKEAFDVLIAKMRDIKRRYFLTPPLADSDYIALGLKPHNSTHSPSGEPTAQVTLETYLTGRHELGVKIVYVSGNPTDPANKGYRIWYSVVATGEVPPTTPDDLHKSFYTKRKKDVIVFDFNDSGKIVYFATQIENDGKKGPWGPLTSALIP